MWGTDLTAPGPRKGPPPCLSPSIMHPPPASAFTPLPARRASRRWSRSARACAALRRNGRDSARGRRCVTITAAVHVDHFQKELAFLGIDSSPAFVRSPEGNGCAERFIRTLKENLLWVRTFKTVEELRQALLAFRETYNTTWLIERHGFLSPANIADDSFNRSLRQRRLSPVSQKLQAVQVTAPWHLGQWRLRQELYAIRLWPQSSQRRHVRRAWPSGSSR